MADHSHARIYRLVRRIPRARVATYGQIAAMAGSTPRIVGYAMAAAPTAEKIPWQRVINSQGRISARAGGDGAPDARQRRLLEEEGVVFDAAGRVDFGKFGWDGPNPEWMRKNGYRIWSPIGG